jgi:phospholipase/carboxylesterase
MIILKINNIMENKLEYLEVIPDKVDNLLITLHGYGSDYNDTLTLGLQFRNLLKNTAIISVNAPFICENGIGFQWFSLKTMNLFAILKEIKKSCFLLNRFIDEQLIRFNLKNKNLILAGFSQGAMMSLYIGLRREEKIKGIMAFSGMMPDTTTTLIKEIKTKPDIFMVHGILDKVVPFASIEKAEKIFREFDIPFQIHAIENMEHEINDEALFVAKEFIKEICKKYQ